MTVLVNGVSSLIILYGGFVSTLISLEFTLALGIYKVFECTHSFCVTDSRKVNWVLINYDLQVFICGVTYIITAQVFNQRPTNF